MVKEVRGFPGGCWEQRASETNPGPSSHRFATASSEGSKGQESNSALASGAPPSVGSGVINDDYWGYQSLESNLSPVSRPGDSSVQAHSSRRSQIPRWPPGSQDPTGGLSGPWPVAPTIAL
jgi:hypothetical protein